ncbi:UvrD-helicase domain-containing protein [Gilvibacter sediminis]|uniref:UvrD-helicase domain-containing protein n=1 Tax=Gilvibacter sediminis TaxID=379071 RepID=UPI002350A7D9|nr:UvrD-helicase domain-containing protein [Gilvibacter sediminis]MDC7996941.1 UvrD-helicase domain-containing protein [Gilvibacter sediminis]
MHLNSLPIKATATNSPFTVYAASAGSGKTFALVKQYLCQILKGTHADAYRSLLAITFTNKAVAEMKSRILEQLVHFAGYQQNDKLTPMQHEISASLDVKPDQLAISSARVLKDLLHNYGAFAVETIDSFNHRLLRTFAKDLGLRSDFEVTTEADLLLQEAVEAVLAQTGSDAFLTQTLVDFALQNTEEDRSWDPTRQLLEKAKILLNENSFEALNRLQTKETEDFKALTALLKTQKDKFQKSVVKAAENALELIHSKDLNASHFSRGAYPNFMEKLRTGASVKWEAKWQQEIESYSFYTKTQEDWVKATIDEIRDQLIELFHTAQEQAIAADWFQRLYREVIPLTVLNYIQQEYQAIKEDRNLVTVAEFNRRIHQEIKSQPAPFIYERLGERYRHFFIDEFQDTSAMQWNNLIPLIDNALAQEDQSQQQGSLLLVGDAKQSIYRWRGGLPEQFLGLSAGQTPFAISGDLKELGKNWRSYSKVIEFNNGLFKFLGAHLPQGPYRDCYEDQAEQEISDKIGGYVSIDFFEAAKREESEPQYIEAVKSRISQCLEHGYRLKDICVLTRKKDDSKILAQALQETYPVVSPDSLLLKESGMVQFFLSGLRLRENVQDPETRLHFLWNYLEIHPNKQQDHSWLERVSRKEVSALSETLQELQINFSLEHLNSLGLYEALEYLIRCFDLQEQVSAYERHFLDMARSFEQQNNNATTHFLEDWKKQEDAASLQFPEDMDAIRLMTVHKSKGLEFPVVIIPFTDSELINKRNEYLWYAVDPEHYCGFTEFHLPITALKTQDPQTYESYLEQRLFDELNVWYVALTRAEEQLHLLSSTDKADLRSFGGMLRMYLEQQNETQQAHYSWGTPLAKETQKVAEPETASPFISTDKGVNKIRLIASPREKYQQETRLAQERGNRLHLWLSKIDNEEELPRLFEKLEVVARYSRKQLAADHALLLQVIGHPELSPYFKVGVDSKNEAAIIDQTGEIHRPDRLVFEADQVVIIDYKFGSPDPTYKQQLDRYQSALEQLGFKEFKKILVYVQEEIKLETW